VTTNAKLPEIRKEAFAKAREKLALSAKDLGGMACLSHHQISQIENGESSYFYGAQNKFTAAKKVAKLLNLSDEEAFDYDSQAPVKMIEEPKIEEKAPAKKAKSKPVRASYHPAPTPPRPKCCHPRPAAKATHSTPSALEKDCAA
jgi:transcriptional regulator with XRE-family HTH domain